MADEDQQKIYGTNDERDLKFIFEKYDRYIADDDSEDETDKEKNIKKYRDLLKELNVNGDDDDNSKSNNNKNKKDKNKGEKDKLKNKGKDMNDSDQNESSDDENKMIDSEDKLGND